MTEKILLAALLLTLIAVAQVPRAARAMSETFSEIENYLQNHVQSEDAEANMNAAFKWLQELDGVNECWSCFKPTDKPIVMALKQFLLLRTVLDESKRCTEQAFKIMNANDISSGKPSIAKEMNQILDKRIQRIVQLYDEQHTAACEQDFPDLLKEKLESLSESSRLFLKRLSQVYNIVWQSGRKKVDYIFLVHTEKFPKFTRDQYINFKEQRHDIAREDLNKFLVEPCRKIDEHISEELLAETNAQSRNMFCLSPGIRGPYKETCDNRAAVNFCRYVVEYEGHIWGDIELTLFEKKRKEKEDRYWKAYHLRKSQKKAQAELNSDQ